MLLFLGCAFCLKVYLLTLIQMLDTRGSNKNDNQLGGEEKQHLCSFVEYMYFSAVIAMCYVCTYKYTHTHTYVYIYIHTCMHLYIVHTWDNIVCLCYKLT